jgi:hypothetical protein
MIGLVARSITARTIVAFGNTFFILLYLSLRMPLSHNTNIFLSSGSTMMLGILQVKSKESGWFVLPDFTTQAMRKLFL